LAFIFAVVNQCPAIEPPLNGRMDCNDEINLLSECDFTCKRGYALIGEKTIKCGKLK